MKFNIHLPEHVQDMLEKEYRDYVKRTPMTKKEQRAVRDWVKDGHSVYENASGVWCDGQVPVEFLTVWRDEEYIRKHTKNLSPEEARKFALSYYGWDDEPAPGIAPGVQQYVVDSAECNVAADDDLPFH